jgi:hypothetical protein
MTDQRPSPRTAALLGLVAAMAVTVIVLAAVGFSRPPILCAECEDPHRPESWMCNDPTVFNPATTILPDGLTVPDGLSCAL